jgi:hypothetical protein
MAVSYDVFIEAFLDKVNEYKFLGVELTFDEKTRYVDGLLNRACSKFNRLCQYDLSNRDKDAREFCFEIDDNDLDEIVDIVSEGMIEQWLKPYANNAENLENIINTADYSSYSPSELLKQIRTSHSDAKDSFRNMINNYTYAHGDLSDLHL